MDDLKSVTNHFGITQPVDFINVLVDTDIQLFLDPSLIRSDAYDNHDALAIRADKSLKEFFMNIIHSILYGTELEKISGRKLLSDCTEPNETRLGYSKKRFRGKSIGEILAQYLWDELSTKKSLRFDVLNRLEYVPLTVKNIRYDRISDLATRIIMNELIEYTLDQMEIHPELKQDQKLSKVTYWDIHSKKWKTKKETLPFAYNKTLILVPLKWISRKPVMQPQSFYNCGSTWYIQEKAAVYDPITRKRVAPKKAEIKEEYPDIKLTNDQISADYYDDTKKNLFEHHYRTKIVTYEPLTEDDIENFLNATIAK